MSKKTLISILVVVVVAVLAVAIYLLTGNNNSNVEDGLTSNGPVVIQEEPELFFVEIPELLTLNAWQWQYTIMNDDSVIEPIRPEAFVLTLDDDGALFTTTDCNGGAGSFIASEDNFFAVGDLAVTQMACIFDDVQESIYIEQLVSVTHFIITDEGFLALMLPFDSGSMIFAPTPRAQFTPDGLDVDIIGTPTFEPVDVDVEPVVELQ
ncbi:MAG: META domain-containing protein [Pseudomonadales bacterium]|jgi:heat shock protein HslJ|nr:META domain-containing protein [Pseudomonadales bacterium]